MSRRRRQLAVCFAAASFAACGSLTPPAIAPVVDGSCDPGTLTAHRLNRREYDRTVKDLLGVSSTLASTFPDDDSAGGFDNNAEVLSTSPLLTEKLAAAAEDAAAAAFFDDGSGPGDVRYGVSCVATATTACLRAELQPILRDAFRRPTDEADVDLFVAVAEDAIDGGASFAGGLRAAVTAALLSPSFLFRVEHDADDGAAHPLTPWELASRLSYLVWSSMPDAALFSRARDGSLSDPAVLRSELARMLDDPKADGGIVDALAGQWLKTHGLDLATPDPPLDPELRRGMGEETHRVVAELLHSDRPAEDLFDADFTWVNEPLADLYGIDFAAARAVDGDADDDGFVRVDLDEFDVGRRGVLGHAAFLTQTSFPERTSPVKRGVYVVEQLLCIAPGAPPNNVPALAETVVDGPLRERMAAHRASPECAGCHALMDPIGFGLEGFGTHGEVRAEDEAGFAIDDDDVFLRDAFHSPAELAAVLKARPEVEHCFVEQLTTFALGRGLDVVGADRCVVDGIVDDAVAAGFSLREILTAVVDSEAFRTRRAYVDPAVSEGVR